MKNTLFPPALILCISMLFISCSSEDTDDLQAEDLKAANFEVYFAEDLEGTWDLHSMTSDVAIDLDGNGTPNKNIMDETDCFDSMYYEFKSDGTIAANQAKLHFNTTGITSCAGGTYSSPYTIKDDMLTVSFHDKNGTYITTTKKIKLSEDKQFLQLNLTRFESQAYIKDDSGNSTEVIESIATVYKKRALTPAP